MLATIPSANRFSANGSCTAAALHAIVDNATLSGLSVADFVATIQPITNSGTAPGSPVTGGLWFLPNYSGSSTNPAGTLMVNNGSNFIPVADGFYAKCNGTISAGDVAVVSDTESNVVWIKKASDAANPQIVGVSVQALAHGESGFIVSSGLAYINGIPANAVVWGTINVVDGGTLAADSTLVTVRSFGRVLDITNKLAMVTGILRVV